LAGLAALLALTGLTALLTLFVLRIALSGLVPLLTLLLHIVCHIIFLLRKRGPSRAFGIYRHAYLSCGKRLQRLGEIVAPHVAFDFARGGVELNKSNERINADEQNVGLPAWEAAFRRLRRFVYSTTKNAPRTPG
jgi:hypothetical protein